MATKKKIHYYVLVISNEGPKFVTSVNNCDRTAEWNYKDKPMEFDKYWAEDLALGLAVNGHMAYTVAQKWELDSQPYRYEDYKIQFVKREDDEDE